jgi:glycosyltransferase involved in cell wall biosynthesis
MEQEQTNKSDGNAQPGPAKPDVIEPRQSISVAMAVYNGAQYILGQLESIAAQSRPPDEIVIGDDCSTDGTLTIIDAYRQRNNLTIRLQTNQSRLGSTRNFEETIARCAGDIIVLSDQDDIWRADKLQQIEITFANNRDAPYVFSNGSLINKAGRAVSGSLWNGALFSKREQALFRCGRGAEVLLRHNVVTGAAMAVRRAAIHAALPIPPGWIHDYWLASVLETVGRGVMIDEPLICYRLHGTQQLGLLKFSLAYARSAIGRHDDRYCQNEAMNYEILADRLEQLGAQPAITGGLREKASFYRRRGLMRQRPGSGTREILRSWWVGDYRRFTPGLEYAPPHILLDAATCLLPGISERAKRAKRSGAL